ncbi:hypothetical protein OsI_19343 [Oryza sativa Indica Group]|uniref:Uncharacterized protein n=1 Tax=Oryza sativa subsp. indica TaxID=39946 RepID=B8AWA6_ORYSI|nr:hypothetical protein OsI_19343 [Oryza sativa Indica Group]
MPSSSPPLADDRAPMDRRMAQLGSTSGTGLPLQPPTPPSTAPPSTGGDELPALLLRRRSSPTTSPVLPAAGTILRRLTGRSPLGRSLCGFGSSASRAAYDISDMLDEFQSTEPDAGKKKGVFHKLATAPSRFPMASKMKRMRKELAKNTEEHKNFSFVPNTASFEQHRADPRPQLPELTDESVIIGRSEDKRNIIAALLTRGSEEKKESFISDIQLMRKRLAGLLEGRRILIVLDNIWESDQFKLDNLKIMLNVGKKGSEVDVIVTTRTEEIAKRICTVKPYKLEPLNDDICWAIIKIYSAFEGRGDKQQVEVIGQEIATKCGDSHGHRTLEGLARPKSPDYKQTGPQTRTNTSPQPPKRSTAGSGDGQKKGGAPRSEGVVAGMKRNRELKTGATKTTVSSMNPARNSGHHGTNPTTAATTTNFTASAESTLGRADEQLRRSDGDGKGGRDISQKDDRLVTLTMHDPVHDMARSVIDDELIVLDDTKENKCGQSTYRYVFITNYDKPSKEFSMILHGKIRALHLVGCSKTKLNDGAFSSAKCLRVLDLNHCSIQKLPDSIYQLKQLQYLHAPQVRDGVIPESISMLSKLNYLNLRESPKISKLPESIGKLEALTYLNLSGCSHLVEFPESFGELRNLEHLDLSGCSRLVELPETVGKLDALMYLNLSGSRIVELPESFRELKNLVHLDLSNCTHLTDVSEHLGSLNRLYRPRLYSRCLVAYPRRRKIQELSSVQKENEASHIHMQNVMDAISRLVYSDSGYSARGILSEALGSLTELKYLNLSGCLLMVVLPGSFGNLENLVHLDLSGCSCLEWTPDNLVGLTKLQHLNLSHYCTGTPRSSMPSQGAARYFDRSYRTAFWKPQEATYPEPLELLPSKEPTRKFMRDRLPQAPICDRLPGTGVSQDKSPSQLHQNSFLDDGNGLLLRPVLLGTQPKLYQNLVLLPNFVVHVGDNELGSNIFLLQDANPAELQISCLENVQSTGEVKRIKLSQKTSISKLALEWRRDAKRFADDMNVLEQLVPPNTLSQFELRGYNNVCLPRWLTCISSYLPDLVRIVLDDIPSCSSLPPLGVHVPKLQELEILDCPKLKLKLYEPRAFQWKISNSDNIVTSCGGGQYTGPSSSSSSTTLDVQHCKVPLDQWTLLCHLPALHELRIYECDDLTCSSPEIIESLSSIKQITVECQDMVELPASLCQFKSLPKLILWKCLKLKSLPESTKHLTSLKSLWMVGCSSMTSLPEGLGHLASLMELNINDCPHLKSLPESIQLLPMLEVVKVSYCPELKRWYEIEENKMKLAHIGKKCFIAPSLHC